QDGLVGDFHDAFGHLVELWRRSQHFIVYSGKLDHKGLDLPLRVDKAYELVNHLLAVKSVYGNFHNALLIVFPSGAFYIEYGVHECHIRLLLLPGPKDSTSDTHHGAALFKGYGVV